jgi:hypothetical protein
LRPVHLLLFALLALSGASVLSAQPTITGPAYSVTAPAGVILPIAVAPACSMNQMLPSGPAVMLVGMEDGVGSGNSVITSDGCKQNSEGNDRRYRDGVLDPDCRRSL